MKTAHKQTFDYISRLIQQWLVVFIAVFAISACSSQEQTELKQYVKDVKKRVKGQIDPLPRVKNYDSYAYAVTDQRDPFIPFEDDPGPDVPDNGPKPPIDHVPQELENYPLDTLAFKGHIQKDGTIWGLVQSPDNTIHRVKSGDFMGKNYGEILDITESQIILKEIVRNGTDGWREREASLAITE